MHDIIAIMDVTSEGSEDLDIAIARHLGFRIVAVTGGPQIMRQGNGVASWDLPRYSRSLDAIISLVESDGGFLWEIGTAELAAIIFWETKPSFWNERAIGESYQADGTFNPALSMCIAFFTALKARKAVG